MFRIIFLIGFTFCSIGLNAQGRNSIWCFGDSAGIDFRTNPPTTFISNTLSRGSCTTMADSAGNLLFYAYTVATVPGNTTMVFDSSHNLMSNGGFIVGRGWYREVVSVPDPANSNRYYLFSIGVTSIFGLYYTIIDMNQNNGLGAVTQKNIMLDPDEASDCISAVRHANGRDWWIIYRKGNNINNTYYKYLLTPNGVSLVSSQNIGFSTYNNLVRIKFDSSGTKVAIIDYPGLVETFNFDRCTGIFSQRKLINPESSTPYNQFVDGEFSPSGRYLYLSVYGFQTPSILIQADLWDSIPANTWDTIYSNNLQSEAGGLLNLAPDGKIYWSCAWNDSINYNFPYPDTVFNAFNTYLSVINQPDSAGAACDFQPYSFYLGAGARTYWGLPNNPDYNLQAVAGSICDSLTVGIDEALSKIENELFVFYHPQWQTAFINAKGITGEKFQLSLFDLMGNVVFKEEGTISSAYYTKDLNMAAFAEGVYIIQLQTEKEQMVRKFVKN